MDKPSPRAGIGLAFVCLGLLGVMPIIANSRPPGFDALIFAVFLSLWQLVVSLPLLLSELRSPNKGIFGVHLTPHLRRRTVGIILLTGAMFGLSTYIYVLAVEKAGAVSTAIAIQAYPLFAILWESLFLKRRKSAVELACTLVLVGALYMLATGGTGRIAGLSPWFLVALGVPFLWSVAHVIVKEVLDRTPITPAQVTFFRVLVSVVVLAPVMVAVVPAERILASLGSIDFQAFALLMGAVYYLELVVWFYAVRSIDVSLASSITVPWPALTMVLAVPVLGETVAPYQVAILLVVVASLYGLLFAGARKRRRAAAGAG
ncbi:DMT family transporter [Roseospira goensis]|uniref:Drug/metabolite transporter (DMT)-like permease n=1 Tax=Roseospira goensis TaxID=391922 RepID=A0A7W6RY79_9PROT|nr:DMT family transporter [Roseospira goensis]MBB4285413.1 drug/metabolite transporter (DMT)-like permease [Roseospira goensis]